MAIPDYQTIMLPLLRFAGDTKGETSTSAAVHVLSKKFQLTDKELDEMLPSGIQSTFINRVGWASTYMKKAGLLEATRRGYYRITSRGEELLRKNPSFINAKLLRQYPEFQAFQKLKGTRTGEKSNNSNENIETSAATPSEALETAFENLHENLTAEIIDQLRACSPGFFEKIVVEVLVKMGYGGSRKDAGQAIGRSGDEGIDGIIKEDRLGLDIIYIQAKKWGSTIGRPEIQKFAGALQGKRARKGVFITTSDFSREAEEYVSHIESKIILINGENLAQLMIDHNVGVSVEAVYEIKKVDSDYFGDE